MIFLRLGLVAACVIIVIAVAVNEKLVNLLGLQDSTDLLSTLVKPVSSFVEGCLLVIRQVGYLDVRQMVSRRLEMFVAPSFLLLNSNYLD